MLRQQWEVCATGYQGDVIKIPTSGDLDCSDLILAVLQHDSTSCEARRANETVGPDLKERESGAELNGPNKKGQHRVISIVLTQNTPDRSTPGSAGGNAPVTANFPNSGSGFELRSSGR